MFVVCQAEPVGGSRAGRAVGIEAFHASASSAMIAGSHSRGVPSRGACGHEVGHIADPTSSQLGSLMARAGGIQMPIATAEPNRQMACLIQADDWASSRARVTFGYAGSPWGNSQDRGHVPEAAITAASRRSVAVIVK